MPSPDLDIAVPSTDLAPPSGRTGSQRSADAPAWRAVIETWIPRGSEVAIVDVPVNRNVGDLFILAVTEWLLGELDCRVVYRAGVRDFRLSRARRHIHPDVVVVGLGGGNFGDLYPKYQALREQVVAAFPDNPIVVLPQTIHFADAGALERSSERLARHRNLRICARDVQSLELARRFTPHTLLLADLVDVAGPAAMLRLANGSHFGDERRKTRGTLHLLRRDDERAGREDVSVSVDWDDLFPEFRWRLAFTAGLLSVAPARFAARIHAEWVAYAAQLLVRAVGTMRLSDRVVTDRLHGAIAARLAGRPVTIVENTYGKLTRYHDAWWRDDPSVTSARRG